jgi:hypothetical protein
MRASLLRGGIGVETAAPGINELEVIPGFEAKIFRNGSID